MPTIVVGQVTTPDLTGLNALEAETALAAVYLSVVYDPTAEASFTVPFGSVLRQTPIAGTDVDPNTTVTVVLSAGLLGPNWDVPLGLVIHSFHWSPSPDGTVDGAYRTGNKP